MPPSFMEAGTNFMTLYKAADKKTEIKPDSS
jgi:hypothetical protein